MIVVVVEAASDAEPGWLMQPLCGEPMILRQLERVRRARTLTKIVVALGPTSADNVVADCLSDRGQAVFRSPARDRLTRSAQAVRQHTAGGECSHLVRLKASRPLVDPELIDDAVRLALNSRAAWTGNTVRRTCPDGLDVEVVAADLLFAAAAQAPATPVGDSLAAVIERQPARYPRAHLTWPQDLSALDWRAETPAGLMFARRVFEALHPGHPAFATQDVLDLLDREPTIRAA